MTHWPIYAGFVAMVAALVAFDLLVLNRKAHVVSTKEALGWTSMWVSLSLLFMGAVYLMYDAHWMGMGIGVPQLDNTLKDISGKDAAILYLTGYIVEQSLSLDNMFVIAMIFQYFRVPAQYQHRVLFWGILGAVVMRGIMILVGAALIAQFKWITYVFGGLLLVSAVKMLIMNTDEEPDVEANLLVKLAKKFIPLHSAYVGTSFLTRIDGRLFMTPLMIVLLMVESADVIFAVDSIPAIFSITRDPFIIFTSNVFAILGLRSLYFALAGVMHRFKYVKAALVFVLAFIGVKMLLAHFYHLDPFVSLSAIVAMLCVGVLASVVADRREKARAEAPFGPEVSDLARLAIKKGRRLVILVFGLTLLVVAIPIGVLPGPGGMIVAVAGLAILAVEFVWARLLLRRVKSEAQAMAEIAAGLVGIHTKHHVPDDPNLDPDDLLVRQAYSRVRLVLLSIASPFSMRAANERAKLIKVRKAHEARKAARIAMEKGHPAPGVSHEVPVGTSTAESRQ